MRPLGEYLRAFRIIGAPSVETDLAFGDQTLEGVAQRGGRLWFDLLHVQLVEIDTVRLEAAQRAPLEAIAGLVDDVEPDVRAAVRQRLDGFLRGDEK